ncbi:MAG TPA: hypothetical protein DDY43_12630 [Synechococcales bacterium UBA10510]|nr:hypothetical protein [Synechococcales bacterium UBA10510]
MPKEQFFRVFLDLLNGGRVFYCAIVECKVIYVCVVIKVCAICVDLMRARWVGCPFLVEPAVGAAAI